MAVKKKYNALGKGLDALISTDEVHTEGSSTINEIKIYQCESLLELHKKMEGVDKKNSIYKNAGMYCLCWEQKQRFYELVKEFQESKTDGF